MTRIDKLAFFATAWVSVGGYGCVCARVKSEKKNGNGLNCEELNLSRGCYAMPWFRQTSTHAADVMVMATILIGNLMLALSNG